MEKIKIFQAGNKGVAPHKNLCAGFTLFELIVVIFIAGISFAIVAVSIGRMQEKRVLSETAKKIFLTLRHAREIAMLERIPVAFIIDEENNSCWVEKNNVLYDKIQTMPERISISGEPIIFLPKGDSSGGTVLIKDAKEREYSIEVDPVLGTPAVKGP